MFGGLRPPSRVVQVRPRESKRHDIRSRCSKAIDNDGEVSHYTDKHGLGFPGALLIQKAVSPEFSYYEIEILDTGESGRIGLGLAHRGYTLNRMPGWDKRSIGYHADDGRLFHQNGAGEAFASRCFVGDVMGCGVEFPRGYVAPDEEDSDDDYDVDDDNSWAFDSDDSAGPEWLDDWDIDIARGPERRRGGGRRERVHLKVFFTRNGEKVGHDVWAVLPPGGFYPTIGMHSPGEKVRINLEAQWLTDCVMATSDTDEPDGDSGAAHAWKRLFGVERDGHLLRYTGRGVSIQDVGLAQADVPLGHHHYYFEIEITDSGRHGYVAIGVARKDYPLHQHPGWQQGSVAYHADDGKLFHGEGRGQPFGPKCSQGDRMGCGIFFRPKERGIAGRWDSWESSDEDDDDDDGEEEACASDEWDVEDHDGRLVYVFFTRNGEMVGGSAARVPDGGFFPTVGMLSPGECVSANLCPRSG